MPLLSWRDDYLVGEQTIDRDHQRLFDLINEFHDAYHRSWEKREIAKVLAGVVAYAEEHFQREERIMAAAGYPDLAVHRKIHEELYEMLYQLQEGYESGRRNIDGQTTRFLNQWLVDHILDNDLRIGEYMRKHARQADAEPASH